MSGSEDQQVVCFLVDRTARRDQVKAAVEEVFGVKVDRVNILNLRGKPKRLGRSEGRRPDAKKAYVRLKAGEKPLEFFEP